MDREIRIFIKTWKAAINLINRNIQHFFICKRFLSQLTNISLAWYFIIHTRKGKQSYSIAYTEPNTSHQLAQFNLLCQERYISVICRHDCPKVWSFREKLPVKGFPICRWWLQVFDDSPFGYHWAQHNVEYAVSSLPTLSWDK